MFFQRNLLENNNIFIIIITVNIVNIVNIILYIYDYQPLRRDLLA